MTDRRIPPGVGEQIVAALDAAIDVVRPGAPAHDSVLWRQLVDAWAVAGVYLVDRPAPAHADLAVAAAECGITSAPM